MYDVISQCGTIKKFTLNDKRKLVYYSQVGHPNRYFAEFNTF